MERLRLILMSIYAICIFTISTRRLVKSIRTLKSLKPETEEQKKVFNKITNKGIFYLNSCGTASISSSPVMMYLLAFGSFETTLDIQMFLLNIVVIIIFTLLDIRARRRRRRLIKEFHELQARQRLESEVRSAE